MHQALCTKHYALCTKKLLLTSVVLVVSLMAYTQRYFGVGQDSTEVGIVEHLGDTIPMGLTFINEQNDTVVLDKLIDKPTVLSFVYFDCPGLCSPLLEGVSEVIEKSDMELGKDYQVITISFNYIDNPEKAKDKKANFLKKHSKERAQHWIYLTGDSANIYRIVNAVGFKFKRVGVDFVHPACIMVISPKKQITRYLYGLTFLPFDLKMAVVESQKGLARPTINSVLEYCFAYDPAGKRYALDILKVSGSIIVFLILCFVLVLFRKYIFYFFEYLINLIRKTLRKRYEHKP